MWINEKPHFRYHFGHDSFHGVLQADDSGLASYVAGQIDRTLSWKVSQEGFYC